MEQELFGVRIFALCQAMAEHWRLPKWVTQGYRLLLEERDQLALVLSIAREEDLLNQQHRLDEAPGLRRWFNEPANTVLLANNLALAAQVGWDNLICCAGSCSPRFTCKPHWKTCSSRCTNKPPPAPGVMPGMHCSTRPKR